MYNALLFSVLILLGGRLDLAAPCPNQLKLITQRHMGSSIEFSIQVVSQTGYRYDLYRDCGEALEKLKSGHQQGAREIEFVEPKVDNCKYRVTFEFEGEAGIICKSKSIEVSNN